MSLLSVHFIRVLSLLTRNFLFFLVLLDVVLVSVESVDPSLDAAQVERVAALLAAPDGRLLIDRVRANSALMSRT